MSEEEKLKQQLDIATSALRWITLAVIFMFVSIPLELVGFVLLFMNNKYAAPTIIAAVGSLAISFYCKWMSDLAAKDGGFYER